MDNLNKKIEPKIVPNLSSNHALPKVEGSKTKFLQQPKPPLVKHDSASFKETTIKYQNQVSPIPNVSKDGNNILMPKMEYTKEENLIRPVLDKEKRLNIQKEKREILPFSKGIVEPVKPFEPSFSSDSVENKVQEKKKKVKNTEPNKKTFFVHILILLIELLILGGALYLRNEKTKTTLECTNQMYNEYYHANIINTKKYAFKKGKITKLVDEFTYTFDTEEAYKEFKSVSANPEKEDVKGRLFESTIDDNKKQYTEKTLYDFKKLRSQNQSEEGHTIYIPTKTEADTIQLLDYNSTDIKLIYEEDYVCK